MTANPQIVLIGSRALVHHLPALDKQGRISGNKTDYDFIATLQGALKWLSTHSDIVKLDKKAYPLSTAHHDHIAKDIKQWKHWDTKKADEYYQGIRSVAEITKFIGHTKTFKFEIE